jgi:chromate transporter
MSAQQRLLEVAVLFLRLGLTAFGGPAAHIAMMRDEVVGRRKWVTEQQFLDLLGASNMIPGPSSTELAIYLGYVRAGWRGLVLAGTLFILPAMMIVLGLAWAYVRYGSSLEATALLYGIKPVIIVVIVQALVGLTKTAVKGILLAIVGMAVLAMYLLGISPIVLMLGGGLLVMLIENTRNRSGVGNLAALMPSFGLSPSAGVGVAATVVGFSLGTLFLTFLKIGALVYGSGYVLLAFLRDDFVTRLGWLTDRQLIDAVAVGQFTPGPVFTTATFIGYLVGGLPGALLATMGIFAPSFLFVAAVYPVVSRLRASPWTGAFLDGVNVTALGLMAAVTLQLARAALIDPVTVALAILAVVLLFRFKVNSAWLVIGGGIIGVLYKIG